MKQLVDIKRRLKAITGIGKITEAMQIITLVRVKKSQDALRQAQKFYHEAENLLRITGLPVFENENKSKLTQIVMIGSNRGFCGSFNYGLFPTLNTTLTQEKKENQKIEIIAIGSKISQYLRGIHQTFYAADENLIEKPASELTRKFIDPIYRSFTEGALKKLVIVYNRFKSTTIQIPTAATLLPVPAKETEESKKYIFEPSLKELQKAVLKLYIESCMHLYIMESINGELGTRLINMRNATDNSKKLVSQLTLAANKARQAGITQELTEISGAFEALKEE